MLRSVKVPRPLRLCLNYLFMALLIGVAACVPVNQTGGSATKGGKETTYYTEKRLRLADHIYEPNIRTVKFYPQTGKEHDIIQPAVIPLSRENPLILEFDELGEEYEFYYFKIISCNADWTQSMRSDMEFLYDYNEFRCDTYFLSSGTRQPYTHYKIDLPPVKLSGNYVVMVYRDGDPSDMVITRRFMVYQNQVAINAQMNYPTSVKYRNENQQIDFTINYGREELINPQKSTYVTIRQNQRWDNAIQGLPPLFVKENDRFLDYRYFNDANNFMGGNEFRAFDVRSIRFLGFNVDAIEREGNEKVEVALNIDKSRNTGFYSQLIDFNGNFLVENYEAGGGDMNADYVWVNFQLNVPKEDGRVYVFGALTDWKPDNRFLMHYNDSLQSYQARVLLKQGYYNYQYLLDNGNPADINYFEGNYYNTENLYEIFFYYRPMGGRSDELIGLMELNPFGLGNN